MLKKIVIAFKSVKFANFYLNESLTLVILFLHVFLLVPNITSINFEFEFFPTAVYHKPTTTTVLSLPSTYPCSIMSQSEEDSIPVLRMNLMGHKKPITSFSFDPSGNQFVTSSEDHSIMIWNIQQNIRSYSFVGHSDVVSDVTYSPNGKLIASCSHDQTVRLWVPKLKGTSVEFRAHTAAIQTVDFSPDNEKLLTGSNDKSLKLWNVERKQFLSSFVGHNNWVRSARFSPDGQIITSCSDDRTVRIWDVVSGECVHVFHINKSSPTCVSVHRGGAAVAVATDSGSLRIYDVRMKKLQQHYALHDSTTSVCWHPSCEYLLTSGKDGKVIIVGVMEGMPLYTLRDHKGAVHCVGFSRNGQYFASGGVDRRLMVWESKFAK